jgi:hypothetical protein
MAQNDQDRHCIVRFYHGAVRNQGKSDAAGRAIFDDKEMCEIKFPGEPGRNWVGPAHDGVFMYRPKMGAVDEDKGFLTPAERFADQFKAWKANDPAAQRNGTPLEHLPFLTQARVYELKAQNIHTAEALAHLSDSAISKLHLRPLVEQAKTYIGEADAAATVAKAEQEKAALQSQFDALRAEIDALKKAPAPAAGDPFDAMTDDALREYLTEHGATLRSNAARDKMLAAARDIASSKAEYEKMQAELEA